MKRFYVLFPLLLATGCGHVPKGGAEEFRAEIGFPGVFKVKKEIMGAKATEKTLRAESATTEVEILGFGLKTSAKNVVLSNPPAEDKK